MSASVPSDRLGQPADAEPDEHHLANVRIGVRLLSSGVVFLFMAFTFAFWYLRELNSNHDFHPANVNPPQGYGIAILVCVIATAISTLVTLLPSAAVMAIARMKAGKAMTESTQRMITRSTMPR